MKRGILAAWALSVLCLVLLAAALIGVDLRPGLPVHLAPPRAVPAFAGAPTESGVFMIVLRVALILGIVLVVVMVVINLFTPAGRKRLLSMAALLMVMMLALTLLSFVRPPRQARAIEPPPVVGSNQLPPGATTGGNTVPFDPQPPRWLLWTALAVSALLAAAGLAGVALFLLRRRPASPREKLAEASRAAVDSLLQGMDMRNVVVRCYHEMSLIIRDELGVQREAAITPREFASILERWGLPSRPVRDLTEVFEEMRYGNAAPERSRDRRALDSLSLIARFCQESR